ncbi:MAG TPA: hypothetical protein VGG74_00395 [Kofleriaceae bacterium]|jgi:hypothetical protein
MKIITTILTVAAFAGCGDNIKPNDAPIGPMKDSGGGIPAAPALGTQIDRMGRPAINTALNHAFDPVASSAGTAKDAYNADGSPGGWTQYAPQFAANLAVIDALDGHCNNQVLYNGSISGGGSATATSYGTLASILSDDELYLDTSISACNITISNSNANYLAVELEVASAGSIIHTTCGGREPHNDVMATSYTALALGVGGFVTSDGSFLPMFSDGATAHTDLSTDFPYLGTPH